MSMTAAASASSSSAADLAEPPVESWLPGLSIFLLASEDVLGPLIPRTLYVLIYPLSYSATLLWCALSTFRRKTATRVTAFSIVPFFLLGWLSLSTFESANQKSSLSWSYYFIIAIVIVPLAGRRCEAKTVAALSRSILIVACIVGALSLLERLFQINPLSTVFETEAGSSIQTWSTYRARAAFTHPLVDGAFLATVGAYSSVLLFNERRRVGLPLLATSLSIVGVFSTGSRSAVTALVIGFSTAALIAACTGNLLRPIKLLLGAFVLGATLLVFLSGIATERFQSDEASASAAYRSLNAQFAVDLTQRYPILGSGPGTSELVAKSAGSSTPIENSLLGLLVSIGLVGLVVTIILILSPTVSALKRRSFAAPTGILAFTIASAGFAFWETHPSSLLLLGFLLFACRHAGDSIGATMEAHQ